MTSGRYTAKDITVLEGLDPVRKRPGMYIGGVGSAGLHHLVWEIFDNAVDEAMNGYATEVTVTLHKDGSSVTVVDNGRGIPVDKHPKSKKPALEVILTSLHAGRKFSDKNFGRSGALHGVGSSVVNTLSEELVATVHRDGHARAAAVFVDGDTALEPAPDLAIAALRETHAPVEQVLEVEGRHSFAPQRRITRPRRASIALALDDLGSRIGEEIEQGFVPGHTSRCFVPGTRNIEFLLEIHTLS